MATFVHLLLAKVIARINFLYQGLQECALVALRFAEDCERHLFGCCYLR